MPIFKFAWGIFQSILTLGVIAISIDYYNPAMIPIKIPDFIPHLLMLGVVGVSAFWALINVVGGGLFGLAASGMLDGVKMGLLLGIGTGISRLWPYLLAWAVGAFVGQGPVFHIILLCITALVLFGLQKAMHYFWSSVQNGSFSKN